MTKYNIHTQH